MERLRSRPRGLQGLRQFATTLFEVVNCHREALFTCSVCKRLLQAPITGDCGHTFCANCVAPKCPECNEEFAPAAVNVLVHGILSRWKEIHPHTQPDNVLPETKDLLGYEPRYHLRSRYAGLQARDINKVLKRLLVSKHCKTPLEKFLRKTSKLSKNKASSCRDLQHNNSNSVNSSFCCKRTMIDAAEKILKTVQQKEVSALRGCWNHINLLDFECILCSRCFFQPVTTSCGHTFCKDCLARVFDHGLACPLCMSPLKVNDQVRKSTQVVEEAIQTLFPKEYSERLISGRKENQVVINESEIPVFVCTNAFPGVACPLYVYEPRYRLLARRCLLSPSKKFGMAMKTDDKSKFASYGTLLEARDAVLLEDGRSIMTTIGIRRFKVVSRSEQDGYDTALVQYIKDNEVAVEKMPDLIGLHYRVHAKAAKWVKSLTPTLLGEVERSIGKMPAVEKNWSTLPDGPSWAWWLMSILPVSSHLQVGFLCSTSLEKRLRAIDKMLEHMKIRMQALERNTVNCPDSIKAADSCGMNERSIDLQFNPSH